MIGLLLAVLLVCVALRAVFVYQQRDRARSGVDIGEAAARHLFRGHSGEVLLCAECIRDSSR